MKTRSILLGAILLAAVAPTLAQAAPGSQDAKLGQAMPGMHMDKNMPGSTQTAQGIGVIEAIDTAKGTVTIKHEAIASIQWPAMTMTFKAEPPDLLKGIAVGERVNFSLHLTGMHGTVTAITRAR